MPPYTPPRGIWARERRGERREQEGEGGMDDDRSAATRREEIRLRAEEAGLGRVAEAVVDLARPGWRLVAEDPSRRAPDQGEWLTWRPPLAETLKASRTARGRTRLGGVPVVGEGFSWPRRARTRGRHGDEIRAGRPLTFVAQVNLAEVPPTGPACGVLDLPRRGVLLFFCDEESLPYGGPEDSDAFRVAYLPLDPDDETGTHLAEVPEGLAAPGDNGGEWGMPGVVVLEALPELALPAPFPDEVRAMGLSEAETDAYWRLTEDLERAGAGARLGSRCPRHRPLPARTQARRRPARDPEPHGGRVRAGKAGRGPARLAVLAPGGGGGGGQGALEAPAAGGLRRRCWPDVGGLRDALLLDQGRRPGSAAFRSRLVRDAVLLG